jgi:hypothetical protein
MNLSAAQPDFPSPFEQELHQYYPRRNNLLLALASLEEFSASKKHAADTATAISPNSAGDPGVRQKFFLIL